MLADTWRIDAATAYLDSLQARGLSLGLSEGRLQIPPGHTPAEVELVRLLKAELVRRVQMPFEDTQVGGAA